MKYTADDLLEAMMHTGEEIPYEQYKEFKALLMGVDKDNLEALSSKAFTSVVADLGAEKFLDVYNEYFKNTLHVGDVYKLINKECDCNKVIITEYDADKDYYYVLFDDGIFSWTTSDSFDFDHYEKIGSIDISTFVHSKNELINKAKEL